MTATGTADKSKLGWGLAEIGSVIVKTENRDPREAPTDPFKYVDVSGVSNSLFQIKEFELVIGAEAPSRARKVIRSGDILFATVRPTLRRVAMVPPYLDNEIASTGYCVLRPDKNKVCREFIYYYLLTDFFISHMRRLQRGANYPAVRDADLYRSTIPVPPLPEQRKIARILSTVQRAIELQDQIIATTTELKKALMQKLFTEGLRGEPQKQTEIGQVPESWGIATLEDLKASDKGAIVSGPFGSNIGKRFFVDEGVPLIRGGNLTKGDRFFIEEGFVYITEQKASELTNCQAVSGDLLFTAAGTLGQVGIIPLKSKFPKYVISNKQLRARVDEKIVNPLFLFFWFSTPTMRVEINMRQSGAPIPVINLSILKSLPIPLPSLDEQNEIVERIDLVRAKRELHLRKRAALSDLFETLLHKLMTAEICVDDLDLSDLDEPKAA